MSYQETATKKLINSFLASRAGSRALVIDGEGLCTARTLTMADITVLNDDVAICRAAESAGFKAACGVSTFALRGLSGNFDIIYLDYGGVLSGVLSGVPRRGFDPAFDLLWAGDHLTPDGIVLATYMSTAESAEGLIPLGLQLAKSYVSNEAICLIMVANNSRSTRDAFNAHVTMSKPVTKSKPVPKPVPKTKSVTKPVSKTKSKTKPVTKTKSVTKPVSKTKKTKKSKLKSKLKKLGMTDRQRLQEAVLLSKGSNGSQRRSKRHADICADVYAEGTPVIVNWDNTRYRGIVVEKKKKRYDVFFPGTNEVALIKRKNIKRIVNI